MSTNTPESKTIRDRDAPKLELIDPGSSTDTGTGFDGEGNGHARFAVPDNATDGEAAALAACLNAYLRDRQGATVTSAAAETESADGWALAGRYGCRCRDDLPRSVDRGEEWKMAERTGR